MKLHFTPTNLDVHIYILRTRMNLANCFAKFNRPDAKRTYFDLVCNAVYVCLCIATCTNNYYLSPISKNNEQFTWNCLHLPACLSLAWRKWCNSFYHQRFSANRPSAEGRWNRRTAKWNPSIQKPLPILQKPGGNYKESVSNSWL